MAVLQFVARYAEQRRHFAGLLALHAREPVHFPSERVRGSLCLLPGEAARNAVLEQQEKWVPVDQSDSGERVWAVPLPVLR